MPPPRNINAAIVSVYVFAAIAQVQLCMYGKSGIDYIRKQVSYIYIKIYINLYTLVLKKNAAAVRSFFFVFRSSAFARRV